MLEKDKERLKYKDGTGEMSALDKRINALIGEDVQYLKEYGKEYFEAGTGLFGRLGISLGDSGKGRRVFNEIRKANNQMGDVYTNQELLDMINNRYKKENLKFEVSSDILPKEKRTQKAAGGLENPEKADLDKDGNISSYEEARGEAIEESMREQKQEGGPMSMDDQMKMAMDITDESQMDSDDEMEDSYLDFIINEALSDEEEEMLMTELQSNPQLSILFDKVLDVAMEFSGSGSVEGPGSEVSDSIPARLSDGEFVFTAKAVDVIGADNLMSMMKQAEAQANERLPAQEGGPIREEMQQEAGVSMPQETTQNIRVTKETVDPSAMVQEEEDIIGDEIRSQMMLDPYQRHVRS